MKKDYKYAIQDIKREIRSKHYGRCVNWRTIVQDNGDYATITLDFDQVAGGLTLPQRQTFTIPTNYDL